MRTILLLLLLIPTICSADAWYHYEIPYANLGCDSFFRTYCYDDFDAEVRFFWQYYTITDHELETVYKLEKRLYENGMLLTEPLHWQDYSNPELWNKKYTAIVNSVKIYDVK